MHFSLKHAQFIINIAFVSPNAANITLKSNKEQYMFSKIEIIFLSNLQKVRKGNFFRDFKI